MTVVVIDKQLLERCDDRLPSYLNYSTHAAAGSRFNTPPTFAIYVTGLVCKWLQEEMGGLEKLAKFNHHKAKLVYDVIDESNGFFRGHATSDDRSVMNVVFNTPSEEFDKQFLQLAEQAGMTTLKGHRSIGGIRASIYNAMPLEGVQTLVEFMQDFAQKNG